MFVNTKTDPPQVCTLEQIRKEHPSVSFPVRPSDEVLKPYGFANLKNAPAPSFDPSTHKVQGVDIVWEGGWLRRPAIVPLSQEEIEKRAADAAAAIERQKRQDYQTYSDPIFFKWQAGEATQQDWLDARALVDGWYKDENNG